MWNFTKIADIYICISLCHWRENLLYVLHVQMQVALWSDFLGTKNS